MIFYGKLQGTIETLLYRGVILKYKNLLLPTQKRFNLKDFFLRFCTKYANHGLLH